MTTSTYFDRITAPATVTVLVSKDCPNCARVVEQARDLERRCPSVVVSVRDVFEAQDLRERHAVQSVPATIVDDDLMLQGPVTAWALAEILASRGTPSYDSHKVRAWLHGRQLERVARFLREPGRAPSVLPLLETGDLSDRMAVTLAIQMAQEAAPGSLRDLVPGLISLLASESINLRGDVADLLGILADPRAMDALEGLLADPDEDVVAAATDALATIRGALS